MKKTSIVARDPYGSFPLDGLLQITSPREPKDFDSFWQQAYQQALGIPLNYHLKDTGYQQNGWSLFDLSFQSTDSIWIGGWLLVPTSGVVKNVLVIGHGYSGREGPDFDLPFNDAVLYFPCCRGISKSAMQPFSSDPYWHVVHNIDKKHKYIIRGCVEDIWLSVSVLAHLYPEFSTHIGLLGISFSGGVGTLAVAFDKRIAKAHFNVPTFGHYALRLKFCTQGSGRSVQDFYRKAPYTLLRTLPYFDASLAAKRVRVPVHFALALRDPVVTPPGQFSIYNQITSDKKLFVLEAGHDVYPNMQVQQQALLNELQTFFS